MKGIGMCNQRRAICGSIKNQFDFSTYNKRRQVIIVFQIYIYVHNFIGGSKRVRRTGDPAPSVHKLFRFHEFFG